MPIVSVVIVIAFGVVTIILYKRHISKFTMKVKILIPYLHPIINSFF